MLLLRAYRLLLLSTDAGFYFLSLHFKRCSARKLHIISSIKIFTGSFCVAYSCWNQTWSWWCVVLAKRVAETGGNEGYTGTDIKAICIWGLKQDKTQSHAFNRMICRPYVSGIVAAGGSTVPVMCLLVQVEVESKLPHGYLSSTSLPVKFCCSGSGMMCASCLLLFHCCPFSSAIPFRLGEEHAS